MSNPAHLSTCKRKKEKKKKNLEKKYNREGRQLCAIWREEENGTRVHIHGTDTQKDQTLIENTEITRKKYNPPAKQTVCNKANDDAPNIVEGSEPTASRMRLLHEESDRRRMVYHELTFFCDSGANTTISFLAPDTKLT